ncbi:MAG TPA: PBSX family phage terminase large subunit [Methanoregulaceae archaeon]|nr:PBSX family phage terminase large subunit [Methanoregulaceae archaeon]
MPTATLQRIDTFDRFLTNQVSRINAIYGGAGSGKSMAVAQELILKFLEEGDIRILVTRKTLPSLRITAYQLIRDILNDLSIPYDLNKSEMVISLNNNKILFKSLDDPEKVKSAEFNYIWVEEATEISREDLTQLNLRLRRPNKNGQNRIYLTFNPIDAFHYLITDIVQGNRDEVAVHHSTYKDNPFLPEEYVRELENLINQNENFYRIYTLGEPGVLKDTIYTNYDIVPYTEKKQDVFYGLDFGYNNPTALVEISVYDNIPFIKEVLYKTNLTNQDLITHLQAALIPETAPIYADPAEPQRIREIRAAGYNILPAAKGSIQEGIDFMKRLRLKIDRDSPNLINEIRGYQYRTDKDGRVLEDPVKFRDHLMDAMRYAIVSHMRKERGTVIRGIKRNW